MNPYEFAEKSRQEIRKAVVGQDEVVTQLLACFLAGGHALLEGVPGLAKTLLAKTLAAGMGLVFKRVQFTPDLMPSDVTGTNVYETATSQFMLRMGPIFTDILLADEVNRTPPKTQSALLEAMEERTVTIDGSTHPLHEHFFVMATQNPVEYEGTYPLPEAQLDRFMLKILVDYPNQEEEESILARSHAGFNPHKLAEGGVTQIVHPEEIGVLKESCQKVTVNEGVLNYVVEIVRATRKSPLVSLGASPRAGVALLGASKALAAVNGKDYLTPDDIQKMAYPVLRHRLLLRPESLLEDLDPDACIRQILQEVPVPR